MVHVELNAARAREYAQGLRVLANRCAEHADRLREVDDPEVVRTLSLSRDLVPNVRGLAMMLEEQASRGDFDSPVAPGVDPVQVWRVVEDEAYPPARHASELMRAWNEGRADADHELLKAYCAGVLLTWEALQNAVGEAFPDRM